MQVSASNLVSTKDDALKLGDASALKDGLVKDVKPPSVHSLASTMVTVWLLANANVLEDGRVTVAAKVSFNRPCERYHN